MNTPVNFELAKLLKEKGYSWECEYFYKKGKYDKEFYLTTGTEYQSDKSCIWDWNLNGGKSGNLIKTIPYPNEATAVYYSAPTIAEVVMWLYEKHGVWINVNITRYGRFWCNIVLKEECKHSNNPFTWEFVNQLNDFTSPTQAYEAAIKHYLKRI